MVFSQHPVAPELKKKKGRLVLKKKKIDNRRQNSPIGLTSATLYCNGLQTVRVRQNTSNCERRDTYNTVDTELSGGIGSIEACPVACHQRRIGELQEKRNLMSKVLARLEKQGRVRGRLPMRQNRISAERRIQNWLVWKHRRTREGLRFAR
jgi:hypothetical protein